ncbi:MAG TPA: tRNA uridine-5-carboxymethylaminomethyl(34) synthesis GTPase MnmE [Luteitalea sp.]|nr:tRNA uridine-5-carboxymethylaminomethyl(34) synthesis GTPase MnmE [Luteitalea sp.]
MQPAEDVIVAAATGPGRSALAIVRVSGAGALPLASALAGRVDWEPRRATLVTLQLADGLTERALVTTFPGPASYTGEDLVEFTTHGSPVIVDALMRACTARGARLAEPGEFTLRAHLHGRVDLVQAEAVQDLVSAVTPAQVRVASAHLEGVLSTTLRRIGDEIAELRALLEASLDFPDEGFHFISPAEVETRVSGLEAECRALLGTADAGRRLHDGALVVIAGRPNAGKSSLFNALLGRPRAIVTDVPGTTRDLLSESIELGGVPVTLVDTAGLHETVHVVEREGVARSRDAMSAADIVIVAVDPYGSDADLAATGALWEAADPRRRLCVVTKQDLGGELERRRPGVLAEWIPADAVMSSAVAPGGIDGLTSALGERLGRSSWEGTTLTHARHRSLVEQCAASLGTAVALVRSGGSEEFLLVDLQEALQALARLRGLETSEDVLRTIFASFCIGK